MAKSRHCKHAKEVKLYQRVTFDRPVWPGAPAYKARSWLPVARLCNDCLRVRLDVQREMGVSDD